MNKNTLQEQCRVLLTKSYSAGGIAGDNEYNQFLCDTVPELIQYLSVEGLRWFKKEMQHVHKNTLESDKD